MRIALRHKQRRLDLEVRPEGGRYRVAIDGHEHLVEAQHCGGSTVVLVIDGRRYRADLIRQDSEWHVALGREVYTFVSDSVASSHVVATVAVPEITAPMPGKVLQVLVQPGQPVAAGDGLLILEAMKMENRLVAEAAGVVTEVRVAAGDLVDGGQVLMVLRYATPSPP